MEAETVLKAKKRHRLNLHMQRAPKEDDEQEESDHAEHQQEETGYAKDEQEAKEFDAMMRVNPTPFLERAVTTAPTAPPTAPPVAGVPLGFGGMMGGVGASSAPLVTSLASASAMVRKKPGKILTMKFLR
jgi:hypothetical protein